jgi:hypothetical protein
MWFPGDQPGYKSILKKIVWFFGARGKSSYGRWSGKILTDYINVDVLVTVKPYHAVKIQAVSPEKLAPNEIASIPILVENQGNYNDTFSFRIKTETGYPLILTNNVTNTLRPGEQGQALVGISAPANILDTGTLHSIIIETYSIEQPNTSIATQRIFIETQGFYLSEQNSIYTLGFGFFILFVLCLIIYWRRKVSRKILLKPEEGYRKFLRKKSKETKPIKYLSTIYKKAKTSLKWAVKPEKKPAKSLSTIFKKSEKPIITEQKKKTPRILAEDITKEKALAKIRREQEKQLQKMKI